MMLRWISLSFCIVLFLLACKKEELQSYDNNFTGTWRNRDSLTNDNGLPVNYYLKVDGDNSEVKFSCDRNGTCSIEATGKIVINRKHTKMMITDKNRTSFFRVRLDVNQMPYRNSNGFWLCTIENVVMIRD